MMQHQEQQHHEQKTPQQVRGEKVMFTTKGAILGLIAYIIFILIIIIIL